MITGFSENPPSRGQQQPPLLPIREGERAPLRALCFCSKMTDAELECPGRRAAFGGRGPWDPTGKVKGVAHNTSRN